MKKLIRVLGIIVLIPIILIVLGLLASVLISPPGAGEEPAAELSIPYPVVIAHRGASHLAPESTVPAYLLAREMGADYLEVDVQRTADGVLIAFHDDTPERTTNVAEVFPGREQDFIETFSYEELLELDAGSWFNEAFPEMARDSYVGLRILTLDEVITIAEEGNNNPGLYLETKSAPRHPGIEQQIIELLSERGWLSAPPDLPPPVSNLNEAVGAPTVNVAATPARVIFQSFHFESIIRLKDQAPDLPRVLLISEEMEAQYGWDYMLDFALDYAQGIGPVGYLGWPWHIGPAHRKGLVVHPYTINEAWQMRLLSFFGADGFFTDRSELAIELLGKGGPVEVEAVFERIGY